MNTRFALLGYPIAHSLSPKLFEAAYSGKYAYDLIESSSFDESWTRFLKDYSAVNITAPYKGEAFLRADVLSPECARVGATNLCVKSSDGITAYNTDYSAVKYLLESLTISNVSIIGYGGAGKAAFTAAKDAGFDVKLFRHNELRLGVEADMVIYTLPKWAEGADKIRCTHLIEANYKNPCLTQHSGYIGGKSWLLMQAVFGYSLMTGETPDKEAMMRAISM